MMWDFIIVTTTCTFVGAAAGYIAGCYLTKEQITDAYGFVHGGYVWVVKRMDAPAIERALKVNS